MWFETTYIKQCNTRSSADTKRLLGAIQSMRFSMALFSVVSREQAAKFHRPWRGPYRVVKVLLGVTYCIQIVSTEIVDVTTGWWYILIDSSLTTCHRIVNHQHLSPDTGVPNTRVTPQPEITEDEMEPWVSY